MKETIKTLLSEFFMKYNYQERLKMITRFEIDNKRFEEARSKQKKLIKELENNIIQTIKEFKCEK